MPSDDNGWGNETRPRAGHSGRFGIDKILKEVRRGDLRAVKRYLKQAPSLLYAKSGGHNRTFLWEATRGNRINVVRFLLREGADPNIPGRTRAEITVLLKPYCIARRYRRPELAGMLEKAGTVMDIYSACYLGDTERVQHLLKSEPDLFDKGTGGRLCLACDTPSLCRGGRPRATRQMADWRRRPGEALYQAVVRYGRAPEASGADTLAGRRGCGGGPGQKLGVGFVVITRAGLYPTKRQLQCEDFPDPGGR